MNWKKRVKRIIRRLYSKIHPIDKTENKGQACPFHAGSIYMHPQTGKWTISGFKDALSILSEDQLFSTKPIYDLADPHDILLTAQGERHKHSRELFRNELIKSKDELESAAKKFLKELLSSLPSGVVFDFKSEIVDPYIRHAIKKLMGMTKEEIDMLRDKLGDEYHTPAYQAGLRDFFIEIVQFPVNGSNQFCDLLRKEIQSNRLKPEEAGDLLWIIWIAGLETSINLISRLTEMLIGHKHLHSRLIVSTTDRKKFIEECIRLHPPISGVYRRITQDVDFGETILPKDTIINIEFFTANRDGDYFSHPDEISFEGNRSKNISFGAGVRQCLGMNFSRLEARVFLDAILPLVPYLEIAEISTEMDISDTINKNIISTLKIILSEKIPE